MIGLSMGASTGGLGKNYPFGILFSTFSRCAFISSMLFLLESLIFGTLILGTFFSVVDPGLS